LSIRIFYDRTNFRIQGWRKISKFINKVIEKENMVSGDLRFVITSDDYIREINNEFLKHNYKTDIIAFNYNSGILINGEIYISIDTVKENALNYRVSLNSEIKRVIIHGILHLLGYDDKTSAGRSEMRKLEEDWMKLMDEE
jgi:probable rRNA maturation factor